MAERSDMQAVIDAARAGVGTSEVSPAATPIRLTTSGQVVDLRNLLPAPERKRGTVTVFDAESFNRFISINSDAGNIAVYVDRNPDKPAVVGVLNGHGAGGSGWGDFRVQIAFRPTPQWVKWRCIDGKLLPQSDFAEFIEDNLADISRPSGAEMLEIATKFAATRTTKFKSALRLDNGQVQFENVEDTAAKVGKGLIEVPERIELALAPLQGAALYSVPARFRWRLVDGELKLGVKLERIEDLMERVLGDVVGQIDVSAGVMLLEGVPPTAG